MGKSNLKFLVWNCNGAAKNKMNIIREKIISHKIALVIITESHKHQNKLWLSGWKSIAAPAPHAGIVICYRNDLQLKNVLTDPDGRYIRATVKTDRGSFQLFAIYAPAQPWERRNWYAKYHWQFQVADAVIGDFNWIPDSNKLSKDVEYLVAGSLSHLTDAGRHDDRPTYRDCNRIDRIYLNPKIFNWTKYHLARNPIANDHHIICCATNLTFGHTPPEWRLKSWLFRNPEDLQLAEKLVGDFGPYPRENWINFKLRLQSAWKQVEKTVLSMKNRAEHQARQLLKQFPNSRNAPRWRAKVAAAMELKTQAKQAWAHISEVQSRELPSAWLTWKLRRTTTRPEIKSVNHPLLNREVKEPEEILDAHLATFRKLYSFRESDTQSLSKLLERWNPPDVDLSSLGQPFEMEELEEAIDSSANRKSPGPDGLPIEVYKCFNNRCREHLLNTFNEIATTGFMPRSWKEGRIILLYKKGDKKDILNYRPITLLNADYKLLCKILANRLNVWIKELIPSHQIGFMPRRLIYDNIITLDYALRKNAKAVVLDFAKAYDSISHDALLGILDHLRFPSRFKGTVKTLLEDSYAKIVVNGLLTDSFPILRGVKQGDPLSPLLFSLVVEPLQHWANSAPLEDFIPRLNDVPTRCLMYADDTVLLASDDEGIHLWLEGLKVLEDATGLTINKDKTFLLNTSSTIDEIKPSTEVFRYLGFNFTDKGLVDDWSAEVLKARQRCKQHAAVYHTITMKSSVLKTYILSPLWFKGFLIGKPDQELSRAIRMFLWGSLMGAHTKVSSQRAIRPKKFGGLGLWDFDVRYTALKASLALRILHDEEMKTRQIFRNLLDKDGLVELLRKKRKKNSPFSDSPVMDALISALHAFLPIEGESLAEFLSSTHSVKEIQEIIAHKRKLDTRILTPRQKGFLGRGFVPEILFSQVNRIANLKLRHFLWMYFQGGLPFKHEAQCHGCVFGRLSHQHIFFGCSSSTCTQLRGEADSIVDLIYNKNLSPTPRYKTHIPWDEVTFWREWSQTKPSCQAVREVMAITLWAIWKSFASPCTVRQLLIDHLNDEIAASHTIKNPTKREARIKTIHQRWRTKLYWTANNNLPYGYILPRRRFFQPALYDLQVIPEALNEPSRARLEDPFDLPF